MDCSSKDSFTACKHTLRLLDIPLNNPAMAEVLYPKYKILDHQWAPAVLVQVRQDNIYTHMYVCIEKETLD